MLARLLVEVGQADPSTGGRPQSPGEFVAVVPLLGLRVSSASHHVASGVVMAFTSTGTVRPAIAWAASSTAAANRWL